MSGAGVHVIVAIFVGVISGDKFSDVNEQARLLSKRI